MIQIKNLSKSFDKKILDNVNIEIEDGSIVGLIGINGAGKSTLFKILAGIYDPDEGEEPATSEIERACIYAYDPLATTT